MTATLRHLISKQAGSLYQDSKEIKIFRQLAREHQSLQLQYRIMCAHIAHNLRFNKELNDKITHQLRDAYKAALFLEHLYRDYLNNPFLAQNFHKEKKLYLSLLSPTKKLDHIDPPIATPLTHTINGMTMRVNLPRFCFLRFRRLLITANPLMHGFERYYRWINQCAIITGPFVNYAGWIFFIPRLSNNLFLLAQHLIPIAWWMNQNEMNLGWKTRLYIQFDQHWFELTNDIIALSAGLFHCFISITPNFYLIALLFIYDAIRVALRSYREINRLHSIASIEAQQPDSQEFLFHLHLRIDYEKKSHLILFYHSMILVLSGILMLPIFTSPLVPVLGATIALLATITNAIFQQKLDQQRPADTITYNHRFSFFPSENDKPSQKNQQQDLTFSTPKNV